MVSWYILNVDAQNSTQVPPEVRYEGVPIVANDGLAGTIAGQPPTDEGVATGEGGGVRKRYAFNPFAFSTKNA